jgi:hypothetical protein
MKGICKNSATPSKDQNLRITGIEEGEEVQTKGIHSIFNKIITENFAHSGTRSLQDTKQI